MNLRRLSLIIIPVLLMLCVGGAVYAWQNKTPIDPTINLNPPSADQKATTNENKGRFEDQALVVEEPSAPTALPIEITNAYQDDGIGKVVIQTKLPGTGWETCRLLLKNGDETIKKEAKALYQPTASICKGFSIERAEFRSTGQWTIELSADNLNESTSHVSSTFEVH